VSLLEARLVTLVRESNDKFLWLYVVENICQGVPPNSDAYVQLKIVRDTLLGDEINAKWQASQNAYQAAWNQHRRQFLLNGQKQYLQMQMQQLEALKRSMKAAEYQAFEKRRLDLLMSEVGKQNQVLQGRLRTLAREDSSIVVEKLQDADPWVRWAAIQVASRKWLPVEKRLIELLADPCSPVSDAAHKALIRLSRGNDFGPPAKATAVQVAQAQEQWQDWLDLQIATRKPANLHD
jgi:hypothetical protein